MCLDSKDLGAAEVTLFLLFLLLLQCHSTLYNTSISTKHINYDNE